jgi:cyclopropane fatty-acyl-phospholipid synthase-like methyltransferase
MDFAAYDAQMLDYYTNRIDRASEQTAEQYAREFDGQFNTDGHWHRELAVAIQEYLAGRRVLELACGPGRWTRFLVRTAEYLLATDCSPRALSRVEGVTRFEQDLHAGRFDVATLDAYRPDEAPGEFDAALVVNWFQHMPTARHAEFIARLHQKIGAGGRVMLAINHLSPASRGRLIRKSNEIDWFEPRETFDGRPVEIIDNFFSESDLRRIFEPHARDLTFHRGKGFYWICYRVS